MYTMCVDTQKSAWNIVCVTKGLCTVVVRPVLVKSLRSYNWLRPHRPCLYPLGLPGSHCGQQQVHLAQAGLWRPMRAGELEPISLDDAGKPLFALQSLVVEERNDEGDAIIRHHVCRCRWCMTVQSHACAEFQIAWFVTGAALQGMTANLCIHLRGATRSGGHSEGEHV